MSRARDVALYALRAIGGFAICRFLTRTQLRVLCYHGFSIGDEYQVAPGMFIRAQTFERRMAILRRHRFPVLSLEEAVKRFVAGEIHDAETVITFDDGWASNLTIGVPILERFGYPACVYVTTEHLAATPEVFNVALSYLVRKSGRASLTLAGIHPQLDGEYRLRGREDEAIVEIILATERAFPLADRHGVLQTIAAALGMDLQGVLAGDRFRLLTAAEMREITRHNIDLHLHTDSHRLPDSYETVAREIELNRAAVTAITGVPSRHFCYPSGEYTARHPQWLSALGIVSGTTCDPGLNSPGTSVMLLKRFLDSDDFSDISFEAEVCGVREIARRLRARLAGGNGRRAALTVPGSP